MGEHCHSAGVCSLCCGARGIKIIIKFLHFYNISLYFDEVVSSDLAEGPGYKRLLKGEIESAGYLGTAIAFEGYLKYSALFYG